MKIRYLGLGLVLLLIQACGDSTSSPVPTRLVVTPGTSNMTALGETTQFTARLEDKKGREIEGAVVTWSSSNPDVASVTSTGLATGLGPGSATIRASAEGVTGSGNLLVDPRPDDLVKVSGDDQFGSLKQVLPTQPTVEVKDANGNPVEGKFVSFSVVAGGGTATPWQARTGADGRASTVWQLGCSNENPQRLEAKIGQLIVEFTADVDLSALAICEDSVPQGRATLPYLTALEAAGGDQGTLAWSLLNGALPPGLDLLPEGILSGVPEQAGDFVFEARVQDGQGASASAEYELRVCDAPVQLTPGESTAFSPSGPDGCGFFLPAGEDGDRYRFGVIYTRSNENSSGDVPTISVEMARDLGMGSSSEPLFRPPSTLAAPAAGQSLRLPGSEALHEAVELERNTIAFHHRLRLQEEELLRKLGPEARPLPDFRLLTRAYGPATTSPDKVSFTNPEEFNSCDLGETVRAIKIQENEVMVIYQDSIQWAQNAVSTSEAQMILDFYAAYGVPVINEYFGGITDINNDGKVVLFVTPVVEEGTAAFVWSGDFFPKTAQAGWGGCEASNAMEMMRFNRGVIEGLSSGNYQAVGTAVHEVKHISSLYKSIIRQRYVAEGEDTYQPLWVEEGTAEIAKEVASRMAWAATDGPPAAAMADASYVDAFTKENYGVILVNAGTTAYLSSQPNGVVVTPDGASERHSVYGSGWHFHRWLGDAYGDAAGAEGDGALFTALNDSLTAVGVEGILSVTGADSWSALMEDYVRAVMVNGTPAPPGSRVFTSYDFPSMNRTFNYTGKPDGDYPWPVNVSGDETSGPFFTVTNTGPIGPSGVRIFDLTSNGVGVGLEVVVTAPPAASPFRIVLVRIN